MIGVSAEHCQIANGILIIYWGVGILPYTAAAGAVPVHPRIYNGDQTT